MKPFNIEEAKAGKPVCTRNGKKARIICFDKKGNEFPLIALICTSETEEEYYSFTKEGRFYSDDSKSSFDLFMASTHHEGWITIPEDTKHMIEIECFYNSKEEAITCAKHHNASNKNHLVAIKVEWDE